MLSRMLRNIRVLSRLNAAPFTISVPILGMSFVNKGLSIYRYLILGIIGFLVHIFGFTFNDIIDQKLDNYARTRRDHPFITGEISITEAWYLTICSVSIATILYIGFSSTLLGFIFFGLSAFSSVIYNLYSKWRSIPAIIAEISLSLSIGLLFLAGVAFADIKFSWAIFIYASGLSLVLLFLNSVPSGLKDLKTDNEFGAKSFVIAMGCKIDERDGLIIPRFFSYYSYMILLLIELIILSFFVNMDIPAYLLVISELFWLYSILHTMKIFHTETYNGLLSLNPLLGGTYGYLAMTFLLLDRVPMILQLFFVLLGIQTLFIPWKTAIRMSLNRFRIINLP